jgi:putative transposase
MEAIRRKGSRLSLRRQCELLCVSRSSLYYAPVPEKPENLELMQLMDKHLTFHPTEGVISMVDLLQSKGYQVGPKRIRRLFKLMAYQPIYRRKNLTKGALKEYIKPYLLRGLKIDRPNQVWCTDITYIPMDKGFMYMTAFIDVYSRKIMGWGISNSMSKKWCIGVLEDAIGKNGIPEIINSDQGAQYTSEAWTSALQDKGIKISMDGKGRATDNAWVERFWKSLKYNYIYLNPCDTGLELFEGVQAYIEYYHSKKHQGTRRTPNEAYSKSKKLSAA